MVYLHNESEILKFFRRDILFKRISYIPYFNTTASRIIRIIKRKKDWINSSGKGDLTPDFYNDKQKIMMEVMRVDDTSKKNKKGKWVNLTRSQEQKLLKKYNIENIKNDNDLTVVLDVNTQLDSKQDHNYLFYKKNFLAVVDKHKQHIENYRKNHPGYKLIFFICDESNEYFSNKRKKNSKYGEIFTYFHNRYKDKEFVECIKSLDIDYLVWYTPNKYYMNTGLKIKRKNPCVAVFNIKKIKSYSTLLYTDEEMESAIF